ncbi:hypothetical protein F383_37097 [Gossypium arboreum]|uniref:Uncharacterized protein n=2 Tax=Gossypium arboreum TaxID=29729 RepID=A0A0B0MED0_GOSAR|nr:hypothetical protein F383_37097 [Gossypium arboreum]
MLHVLWIMKRLGPVIWTMKRLRPSDMNNVKASTEYMLRLNLGLGPAG